VFKASLAKDSIKVVFNKNGKAVPLKFPKNKKIPAYTRIYMKSDLLFTNIGWIYQYNAIPNNKDNQLTNYFMEKTYKHFYGELND